MTLLFIGAPGTGKGTQADILKANYGFQTFSTGEMFRAAKAKSTADGLKAAEYMDKGEWVPDELAYKMLGEHLTELNADKLILDGVVRTAAQIPMLDAALAKIGKQVDRVVSFDIQEDEAVARLSGRWICPLDKQTYHVMYNPPKVAGKCDVCGTALIQREDDKPDAVRHRFAEVRRTNEPILSEYERRGILIHVDAHPSIAEIAQDLKAKLELN